MASYLFVATVATAQAAVKAPSKRGADYDFNNEQLAF